MGHTHAASSEPEPGTLIFLDDYAHARASTAAALRVLIAGGHSLARAGLRALLQAHGRISVVGEASTFELTDRPAPHTSPMPRSPSSSSSRARPPRPT